MLTAQRPKSTDPATTRLATGSLPSWLLEQFSDEAHETTPLLQDGNGAMTVHTRTAQDQILVSVVAHEVGSLAGLELQRRTAQAYDAIHRILQTDTTWYPVRIWNWIPQIHTAMGGGVDRYMVFNAGRFASYYTSYDHGEGFESAIATATGVGSHGPDLIIQVLGARSPGSPVENPRQIRSYRYSEKFGPMPPCFARATLAPPTECNKSKGKSRRLYIGGTASVCGEVSVHVGDVAAQCSETLKNLGHLIAEASRAEGDAAIDSVDVPRELRRFDSMRVFFVNPEHEASITKMIWPYVDHLNPSRLEFVRTEICRRELLVEIEGTALITT